MPELPGPRTPVHTVCGHSVLLPRRLLQKAAALHAMPHVCAVAKLLLSKAGTVPAVYFPVMVPGQLLPKAVSAVLLAHKQPVLSLPAGQRSGRPMHSAGAAMHGQERIGRKVTSQLKQECWKDGSLECWRIGLPGEVNPHFARHSMIRLFQTQHLPAHRSVSPKSGTHSSAALEFFESAWSSSDPDFVGSRPVSRRARRRRNSTWPLRLRRSSSAQRRTASRIFGSIRSKKDLRAAKEDLARGH